MPNNVREREERKRGERERVGSERDERDREKKERRGDIAKDNDLSIHLFHSTSQTTKSSAGK